MQVEAGCREWCAPEPARNAFNLFSLSFLAVAAASVGTLVVVTDIGVSACGASCAAAGGELTVGCSLWTGCASCGAGT